MHQKLTALIQNAAQYSEKVHQVVPAQLSAFGIEICSRYGKCDEIIGMLRFCQMAAIEAVAHYVKEVNYDSKACVCSFVLDDAVAEGGEIEQALFAIAQKSFTHFYWFDEEIIDDGESS